MLWYGCECDDVYGYVMKYIVYDGYVMNYVVYECECDFKFLCLKFSAVQPGECYLSFLKFQANLRGLGAGPS
jgi:hypothetical protein